MCISVCLSGCMACMCRCLWESREGTRFLEARYSDCESPNTGLGPLEEEQVLLTFEKSLQPF